MTLPFLDRAFDVIFVVAGDNKAGVVHELFNVRNRRFKYPVELLQPKRQTFFDRAMISLKLTVNQIQGESAMLEKSEFRRFVKTESL